MKFLKTSETPNVNLELVYRVAEFSLDTVGRVSQGDASLLVNDINLELSSNLEVISVWGLCPHTKWEISTISPPRPSTFSRLRSTIPVVPGTAHRINESGKFWRVVFDPASGWLFAGRPTTGEVDQNEFLPNCVVGIDLVGVASFWFRPRILCPVPNAERDFVQQLKPATPK